MSLTAADVEAIALALRTVTLPKTADPPAVQAVALKLPTFWLSRPVWLSRPAVWIAQVGPILYLSSTDRRGPHKVQLRRRRRARSCGCRRSRGHHSPPTDKYHTIKDALIKAYRKTQAQDNKLLSLSGLGDRKPSALLRHIRSLNADPATLLRAVFLAQLPLKSAKFWLHPARQTWTNWQLRPTG